MNVDTVLIEKVKININTLLINHEIDTTIITTEEVDQIAFSIVKQTKAELRKLVESLSLPNYASKCDMLAAQRTKDAIVKLFE